MRHSKIPKSNRHKKLKSVKNSNDDDFTDTNVNQKNISEQKISRKWQQIMDTKKQMNQNKRSKKKKKRNNDLICVKSSTETIEKGMTRSDKPLPEMIEQGLYESEYHFLQRLTKLTAKARAEATIEDRFGVDFCEKLDSKQESIDKNLETSDNQKVCDNKSSNKNLKRKQRYIKKKEKNSKKIITNDLFGHLKDVVQFGETVTEPPILTQFKFKKRPKNTVI